MKLTEAQHQTLVNLRDSIRESEGGGGCCHLVADEIAARYGWPRFSGSYTCPAGEVICSAHVWNLLPDGTVLDVTADQFGETACVVEAEPGSLAYKRYRGEWYEEFNPATHPSIVSLLSAWTGELDGDQETRLLQERGPAWWLADKTLWQCYQQKQQLLC